MCVLASRRRAASRIRARWRNFCRTLGLRSNVQRMTSMATIEQGRFGRRDPDARGYFGDYGGRFVPETLVAPIEELTAGYFAVRADAAFRNELDGLLRHYVGR